MFRVNGTKYSRMEQIKILKGCLPKISLGPFLKTLSQIVVTLLKYVAGFRKIKKLFFLDRFQICGYITSHFRFRHLSTITKKNKFKKIGEICSSELSFKPFPPRAF